MIGLANGVYKFTRTYATKKFPKGTARSMLPSKYNLTPKALDITSKHITRVVEEAAASDIDTGAITSVDLACPEVVLCEDHPCYIGYNAVGTNYPWVDDPSKLMHRYRESDENCYFARPVVFKLRGLPQNELMKNLTHLEDKALKALRRIMGDDTITGRSCIQTSPTDEYQTAQLVMNGYQGDVTGFKLKAVNTKKGLKQVIEELYWKRRAAYQKKDASKLNLSEKATRIYSKSECHASVDEEASLIHVDEKTGIAKLHCPSDLTQGKYASLVVTIRKAYKHAGDGNEWTIPIEIVALTFAEEGTAAAEECASEDGSATEDRSTNHQFDSGDEDDTTEYSQSSAKLSSKLSRSDSKTVGVKTAPVAPKKKTVSGVKRKFEAKSQAKKLVYDSD